GTNLDRHLVVGAAHTPRLHFQQRLAVLDGFLEELERVIAAALFLKVLHRLVEDGLRGRLLAAPHHRVHKLGHQRRSVNRIRRNFPLRNVPFSWHKSSNPWRFSRPTHCPSPGSELRPGTVDYFLPFAAAAP